MAGPEQRKEKRRTEREKKCTSCNIQFDFGSIFKDSSAALAASFFG